MSPRVEIPQGLRCARLAHPIVSPYLFYVTGVHNLLAIALFSSSQSPTSLVCAYYPQFIKAGVPAQPLKQALKFLALHHNQFRRPELVALADYTRPSHTKRFYLLNLNTGKVLLNERVSHGSGAQGGVKRGDPDHNGMLDRCVYRGRATNMTRPGFFKTAELYISWKHLSKSRHSPYPHQWPRIDGLYNGLRLDGLTPTVNVHARSRGIVMHGAWYNDGRIMGRSYGCPAFEYKRAPEILKAIRGGVLFFAYTGSICPEALAPIEAQIEGWAGMCSPIRE